MKYDFENQYEYFSKDIGKHFPEPLFDELDIHVFVDSDRGHDKVIGISITGLFSVVGTTPTTLSSKRHTVVQTSTFGAEFTALKKDFKESFMLWYHLRSMGIKVSKPTPAFVDIISVLLNASNPSSTPNKKTMVLR